MVADSCKDEYYEKLIWMHKREVYCKTINSSLVMLSHSTRNHKVTSDTNNPDLVLRVFKSHGQCQV